MRTQRINIYLLLSLALTAAVFAGCNGSSNSSSGPSGTMNLAVSDTPVDGATSVVITFTGVEIQPRGQGEDQQGDADGGNECAPPSVTNGMTPPAQGMPVHRADPGNMDDDGGNDNGGDDKGCDDDGNSGAPSSGTSSAPSSTTSAGDMDSDDGNESNKPLTFTFSSPRQIDLMQQQGGNSASLLSGVSLPAGNYAWIRLMIASTGNTITLSDGSVHPLVIPSGDESGLKLVHGFTVADGGVVDFTIDFDLRRSVILANGQYFLKPVLRLMNNVDVGRVSGTVMNTFMIGSTAITDPSCMPAAYVFSGANATPVDINPTSSSQPIATAGVRLDDESGDYRFSAGFLAPGAYTVALVCASGDDPATVDTLTFSPPKNVTVASDNTATVSFP